MPKDAALQMSRCCIAYHALRRLVVDGKDAVVLSQPGLFCWAAGLDLSRCNQMTPTPCVGSAAADLGDEVTHHNKAIAGGAAFC